MKVIEYTAVSELTGEESGPYVMEVDEPMTLEELTKAVESDANYIRDAFGDCGEYEEFLLDCQRQGKCHKAEWVRGVIEGEVLG